MEVLKCADGVFVPPKISLSTTDKNSADAEVEWFGEVANMIRMQFELGDGPDVVLEATGAQASIQTGIQLVKKGGMYVQAGMGREVSRRWY